MNELSPATEPRPGPLEPLARSWAAFSCAGVGLLGLIGLGIYAGIERVLMPPLAVSIPIAVIAVGLAATSLVRREHQRWLLAAGVGGAASGVFLGFVVVLAILGVALWVFGSAIGESL